ncbi:MAG: nucleotide exchange factor GrpE [Planctomycetota bacterium]|jgi:molecular chaperone GrpE|nr:nucleotide exchange factor GrpE [Planctomycetota bacterium]
MGQDIDKSDELDAEQDEAEVIDGAEQFEAEPGDELATAFEEIADLKDRLMRQQAEFDNVRKRLRREMGESENRAIVRFVRPIFTELDNFELAIQHANPEAFDDFAAGVSMIKTNLESVLSSSGIEAIPCEGVFDPSLHEVIHEMESAEHPRGTIVEVFRTGYRLSDQVIRAAQVVVSRPPADAAPAESDEAAAE